jgi:hypothetical protein
MGDMSRSLLAPARSRSLSRRPRPFTQHHAVNSIPRACAPPWTLSDELQRLADVRCMGRKGEVMTRVKSRWAEKIWVKSGLNPGSSRSNTGSREFRRDRGSPVFDPAPATIRPVTRPAPGFFRKNENGRVKCGKRGGSGRDFTRPFSMLHRSFPCNTLLSPAPIFTAVRAATAAPPLLRSRSSPATSPAEPPPPIDRG